MRKHLIMVVDDEPAIVRLVKLRLEADRYSVITASSGEEALGRLDDERPDLIVLDLMMPGIDGFETLRRIRMESSVPVLMLTARARDVDRLRGFQSGADDYLTKPFNPEELAARIAAILRRTEGSQPSGGRQVLRYPGIEIDLERRRIMVNDAESRLSPTEWGILLQLASNAGRVLRQNELLSRVWGPEFADETHYLRTWISRLRAKLAIEGQESIITTFPGFGYRLESPPEE
jgi:two-component system, OmpR family, KDP operon response regulator KdpE